MHLVLFTTKKEKLTDWILFFNSIFKMKKNEDKQILNTKSEIKMMGQLIGVQGYENVFVIKNQIVSFI